MKMDLSNPALGMRVLPAATTPGLSSILDALQGQGSIAEGNCSLQQFTYLKEQIFYKETLSDFHVSP